MFQVGFWRCNKQIWSTHWVDWEDNLKWILTQNYDNLKNEYDFKKEDDLKNEDRPQTSISEMTSKMKVTDKMKPTSKLTFHHDSHTTTDVKPEMIPGVLTGNEIPHD